jgi:glycosyltransferase involved in cell wall biosynthesis
MSYGLPCLVSDIDANLEAVGKLAYSFKSQNIESLEIKLQEILNIEKEELKNTGIKLKKRVKENYESLAVAQETLNLYKNLVN